MNTRRGFLASAAVAPLLAAMAPGAQAGTPPGESAARAPRARAFALSSVRLLPGPFEAARVLDARYLLSLNADRLLHGFRSNAGLAPKAARYGGWESEELCPGHTLGHYLSACSMMWASTGQQAFRQRVNHVVDELHGCQLAARSGLVCAFPDGETRLRNILAGRPVSGVPWYTMHKIMAGLHDAHVHAADPRALPVLARLADWMVEAAEGCDDQRFQQMLNVEHGGMNEVLADLHVLTGDTRYLRLAQRFNHQAVLGPLAEGRDVLDGLHSNTQIPKVIGFARLAETTGEERYAKAARYFWGTVVHRRSFATGGNGDEEHFFAPAETPERLASAKTMEGASDIAAVMVGPIVLAARMGRDGMRPGDDVVAGNWAYGELLKSQAALPQLALQGRALEEAVRPAGAPLSFRARASAAAGEIGLAPFHRIAHERYSLYWRLA